MANPFSRFASELRRGSKRVPTKIVPSYLDLLASRILTQAKKNAPVRTGALRASGRIELTANPRQRIVSFGGQGTKVDYARYVEFGRFSFAPYDPIPYLRPALISVMKDARIDLKKSLTKSLDEFDRNYGVLK